MLSKFLLSVIGFSTASISEGIWLAAVMTIMTARAIMTPFIFRAATF